MKTRKRKSFQAVMHKDLGIRFEIIGAKTCSIGPCFVVIGENDIANRERIFHIEMFDREDFPSVVRDALFLELAEKESKRVKAKNRKDVLEARARDARARATSDADDDVEYENSRRDLSNESSTEYEPEESPEDFEIIAPADSFGLEPLPEPESEEIEIFEE